MSAPALPEAGWWQRAACLDADPEVFFPPKGGSAQPAQMVCACCPVKRPCLAEALALPSGLDDGVRAGLTVRQRDALRARRRRRGGAR
jgi:WhiB family redox-sensing transcriptional regulator